MAEHKPVLLQQQIKQNATELEDFLRDLRNWERDIKRRDEELTRLGKQETGGEEFPAVRSNKATNQMTNGSRETKKKKAASVKQKSNGFTKTEEKERKKERIKSSDYSAWDKFDIDKAIEEVDQSTAAEGDSEGGSGGETSSEDEDELHLQRKIQEANMEKEKGNECFKLGNYDTAINHYTRGMMCDSTNAILPANRAMAFIKKQQFGAAEQDCNVSLSLDPSYTKAYHRRGVARMGLAKLQLAREDFTRVLQTEPGNKQALLELSKLQALEQITLKTSNPVETADRAPSGGDGTASLEVNRSRVSTASLEVNRSGDSTASLETINITAPLQKPVHLRSKKPMKRIPVVEVNDGNVLPVTSASTVAPLASVTSQTAATALPPLSPALTPSEPTALPLVSTVSPALTPLGTVSPALTPSEPTTIPAIPTSYFQFNADFRKLRAFPDKLYQYLKQIPPSSYPKLFQHSLESEMFSAVLTIYKDFYTKNGEDVLTALDWLSETKRFGTLLLFRSKQDTEAIQSLVEYIKQKQVEGNAEQTRRVISKYTPRHR